MGGRTVPPFFTSDLLRFVPESSRSCSLVRPFISQTCELRSKRHCRDTMRGTPRCDYWPSQKRHAEVVHASQCMRVS
jgi:hypothetical protein